MADRFSCGALRAANVGVVAELNGWVNRRRDHGGLIFVDLRDHEGVTQVVFNPEHPSFAQAEHLRNEDVLNVVGAVRRRPAGTENPRLDTGDVEVAIESLEILNRSQVPPFQVNADETVDENLRLEYRYLDLRRPRMQRNLRTRHRIVKAIRDFFDSRDFLEIETPMMIKSTPEGARDYLVPSRLYPGMFYALPQSPQLLKQILMIAGFGKYMQIARCMRDEDQRSDRLVEFTQLDVELSFCSQDDVLEVMESCMRYVWRTVLDVDLPPFPRLTHQEAIARYGVDKPDLRFGLELAGVGARLRPDRIRRVSLGDRKRGRGGRSALPRRRRAVAARIRRADGAREAVRRQGHGLDRPRQRRHEVVRRKIPHRGRHRGASRLRRRRTRATRCCFSPTAPSSRTPSPARCATRWASAAGCARAASTRSPG